MRKIFFTAITVLLMIFALTSTENLRVAENEPVQSEILPTLHASWWQTNFITATGYGIAPKTDEVTLQAKVLAKRSAVVDAYRNLAEQVANIKITAEKNFVQTKINAVIKFATVVSVDYDEFGNCSVVVSVPIFGVNSVAQAVFVPVEKQNFPQPSTETVAEGTFTGLIVDCGDLEVNPILSPEIRSDDRTIYAYENLDYEKVLSSGVVGYVADDSDNNLILVNASGGKKVFAQVGSEFLLAEKNSRVGKNPLVVKVSDLSGDGTCPVISTGDADRILAENQISHFLDDGAVIFKSNRIRGMRM